MRIKLRLKGGKGSGHHGHAGRPGDVGGSVPGAGSGYERINFFDLDVEFPTPGKRTGLYKEVLSWGGDRGDMAGQAIAKIQHGANGIIFKSAGEVVGVASYVIEYDMLYLDRFATKRPGIGRSSMYHIGQVAIGNDVGRIQLVSADNARGFYAKFGLTEISSSTYEWSADDIEAALLDMYESKELIDEEPEDGVFTVPQEKDKDST